MPAGYRLAMTCAKLPTVPTLHLAEIQGGLENPDNLALLAPLISFSLVSF